MTDDPDKATLRRRLRAGRSAHRASLGPDGIAAATRALTDRLLPLLVRTAMVGGYVPHRGEADVLPVLLETHRRGSGLALPRTDGGGRMRFVGWHPDAALGPGFAGIGEPAEAAEVVPGLLLVPLVGFDRAGRRLGQGAGCYDRWLAAHPGGRAIGVGWSVQEVAALAPDPWDVALDMIVTEAETIVP
ncbi:5-formyltetrahydrofolate cyclo-ligase [Sphingomonas sp.]|uniref:5-formyltetrahydrofolate cyclo-ligase n=1 Tax=Sphingomonas sp. TaxID=28214 RepID=UPI003B000D82